MKCLFILMTALAAELACAGGSVTAWSPVASVDLRGDNLRRIAPVSISYSPDFVTGTNTPAGKVELLAVAHHGTYQPVTQTLVSVSSPSVGSVPFGAAADAGTAYRLILRAFDGESPLGEIAADVGLGVDSGCAAGTFVDTSTNKLQRVVDSGARVAALAFDTAWINGTARLALTCSATSLRNGATTTAKVADISAPAHGSHPFRMHHGRASYLLRLTAYGPNDEVIGEPLEAQYVWTLAGIAVYFR